MIIIIFIRLGNFDYSIPPVVLLPRFKKCTDICTYLYWDLKRNNSIVATHDQLVIVVSRGDSWSGGHQRGQILIGGDGFCRGYANPLGHYVEVCPSLIFMQKSVLPGVEPLGPGMGGGRVLKHPVFWLFFAVIVQLKVPWGGFESW